MKNYLFVLILLLTSGQALAQSKPTNTAETPRNVDISLIGLFSAGVFSEQTNLQFGGHDPTKRGFTLQNLELAIGSIVDPYFRADANIIFGLNEDAESFIEVEEAYLTTLALPQRLQLIGGQFHTRFGRLNAQHPHTWDFADQPVINNRFFGPDGLRNPGVQLSWLAPTPFYLELIGSVQNSNGEIATSFLSVKDETVAGRKILERDVRSLSDLLYMGRLKTAWNPSDTMEIIIGGSGILGPNATGQDTRTEVFGMDFYGKWKPLNAQRGFPFVSLQAEGIWRNYEAGEATVDEILLPAETLRDSGFYAQGLWGFTYRWVAGTRVEYVNGKGGEAEADPLRDQRLRISPNLTFYPSEFSKLRLQYNLDVAEHKDDKAVHAVFLQFEFLIGKHGAHLF